MATSPVLLEKHFHRTAWNFAWEVDTCQLTGASECESRTQPNNSCQGTDSSLEILWSSPILWYERFPGGKKKSFHPGCTELVYFILMQRFRIFMNISYWGSSMAQRQKRWSPRSQNQTGVNRCPALLLCLRFLRWAVTSSFHFSSMRVQGTWHKLRSIVSSG